MYLEYAKHIGAEEFVKAWVNTTLKNYLEKNKPTTEEVEHILDYLVVSGKKVSKMSYEQAKKLSDEWTKAQQKKGKTIDERQEDTELLLDFKDGFRVVKLIGQNAYKREGYLMSHCVGGYFGNGKEIYSLRDKDNLPHCTMEKDQQIKGKGNGDIHPRYIGYVVQFLEKVGMTVGDSEMRHLGYINMEKFKKELSKDTKYFNKVYLPTNEKLIGKDGKEFASFDLWDVKPLVVEHNDTLKIAFELPTFIKLSFEYMTSKTKLLFGGKTSSGDYAKNASSGDYAKNTSSGDYAKNASSGDSATNASSGDYAKNASSGDYAKNTMEGNQSVSVDAGHNGMAKGKIGSWFCLSEWAKDKDNIWKPVCVKAVQIDGKKIKEDVWYKLEKGKFTEVK